MDSFTRLALGLLLTYLAVFAIAFAVTWQGDDLEFAAELVLGVDTPFASERAWAALALSTLTLFVLPVVLGVAIGAALDFTARRRRHAAGTRLESLVDEIRDQSDDLPPPGHSDPGGDS